MGARVERLARLQLGHRPLHATARIKHVTVIDDDRVLVVEDDATVRSILCGMLKYDGYHVFEAACGDDALLLWKDRQRDIDLVVTDLVMPGSVDGRSLAIRMREERPDLRLILTTGYVDKAIDEEEVTGTGLTLLRKPYTADEFLMTVRQSLDQGAE